MRKQVWFDARGIEPENESLLSYVYNSSIDVLVVCIKKRRQYRAPVKTMFVVEIETPEELEQVDKEDIIFSPKGKLLVEAEKRGFRTCIFIEVNDRESLECAWQEGLQHDFVGIDFISDTNIPLELVIARLAGTKTVLLKKVTSALDAEIAFGVMEKGSDGVMLDTENLGEIAKVKSLMDWMETEKVQLTAGRVLGIEHIGMGYRACIDTTNLLKKNEGMIVGSTSRGGILVSSETHFLPYMELRPFRVNAGAVHSYIWCPQNMTAYVTELKAGSRVMVVDTEGKSREVTVGRVKTEKRPLLKIEVDVGGICINTIVQDDWHIRVLGLQGEVYNVTSIKPGDVVAAYVCSEGRHVGIKIEESIEEK